METIWAGWRANFVTESSPNPDGECILCTIAKGTDDAGTYVITRGESCYVVLNLYPYTSGHLMVVPTRHVADFSLLTGEELGELTLLERRAIEVLTEVYHPQGFNLGMNLGRAAGAGIAEHLHAHVVPRWAGDANFMATAAITRVLPEALDRTRERVVAAWAGTSD
jgi:ATP adenylyltransferase